MLIFVDPELVRDVGIKGAYLPFLLALFLALWYTTSLSLKLFKLGFWISLAIIFLLILSMFKILTLLITLIVAGLVSIGVWSKLSAKR